MSGGGGPETTAVPPRSCDLLLTNGVLVTLDAERRIIDPGAVAIVGDRIAAVGSADELSSWTVGRVVDCRGAAILPGLVDCHNHLFQGLARGLGDGMALWRWLTQLIWPYAAHITPEEARASALLGAVEGARSGTTSLLDNHYSPADAETTIAVAEAIETVGLRGVVARGIFGPMTDVARKRGLPDQLFRYTPDEEVELTQAGMNARPAGSRVEIWPAPINPTYVDPQLVHRAVELARDGGVHWHTHCSEVRVDAEVTVETHGLRPMEWLDREGLLESGTIAHGIWLSDTEIASLARNGAAVSHCPVANQYLASGVVRLRDLRDAGVTVGLGTDGPGGGQRQDLFECMKATVLLQRVTSLDPEIAHAEDALELATVEGARLLGIDAGTLVPGRLADVVVVDLTQSHVRPLHRAVPAIVYSARGTDVRMTIVNGEVIFEDGRCLRVDEDAVLEEAGRCAEELVARAGIKRLRHEWGVRHVQA